MDLRQESQNRFLHILNSENEQAKTLLDILEQEFLLLKANPGVELKKLLAQKTAQLKVVEKHAAAHHRFLQQQGLSSDRQGTESYLEGCGDNATLSAAWQRYRELLQACQRQNQINGGAVTLNQRQVNQALTLLLNLGDNKTYGRSGESRPGRPSKILGKA